MITRDRLKELVSYDPDLGVFTWNKDYGVKAKKGYRAGYLDKSTGYYKIGLDERRYYAHRLAWLYISGDWPRKEIDHINGHRDDNRIINLREASSAQNKYNSKRPSTNTSGIKGVSKNKRLGKWQSYIWYGNKKLHLGYFDSINDAEAVVVSKRKMMHKEFAKYV